MTSPSVRPAGVAARGGSRGGRVTPAGPTPVVDYVERLDSIRQQMSAAAVDRCRRLHLPHTRKSCMACRTAIYIAVRPAC